jgi:CubicO group peptidase (beta-lactamase class C family)
MGLDAFQKSWQSQDAGKQISINADVLLSEVRRKQQCFRRTIFWRDAREVGVAALLVLVFIYSGWTNHWTLYLCAFGCLVVAAFMVLDRCRQKKKTPDLHDSLKGCAATSLAEVSHQIWLLKNILWWYVLPLSVPMLLFFCWITWDAPPLGETRIPQTLLTLFWVGFVLLFGGGLYWLNHFVVKKSLEPRRQELEQLLAGLETETHSPTMNTNKPLGPFLLVLAACIIAVAAHAAKRAAAKAAPTVHYSDPTSQMLETIRVKHKFPALAAAVVVDGKIVATNAVGFRKHGGTEAVTVNDKFHLGSVTKSMTATVAAMLVEQGKISWTTTIGESFPDYAEELHPGYRDATLEQLLAHRGGAPGSAPKLLWIKAWNASGSPAEQRLDFVKGILARKPEAKAGAKYIYSNQGYAIAGVMLEKAAGKTWEELMRTLLFEPLGMNSAGFGAPATPGEIDQPWGHTKGSFSGFESVPPGPRADNPAAIGPAGTVHCSLPDLARYVLFHLAGEQGDSDLLKAASFKKLHTSAGDDYALGWIVLARKWAGGRALMHNGSNTMFYVVIWMAPERNGAVIVATNVGGMDAAFSGCNEAAEQLIQQFFPK